MSFAYLPWYTGDYRRDTADLTLLEHGIYLLLLAYCWDSRGPVPIDEARAARIVGASSDDERVAVKGVLKRYFVRHDDGWYNPRLDREIARCNAISGMRSEIGRAGAEATWSKRRGKSQAKAMANAMANGGQVPLSPPPSLSPPPGLGTVGENKQRGARTAESGTRLPANWSLPDDWQAWAVSIGCDPQRAVRISLDFRDYWLGKAGKDARKVDWRATWQKWLRKEIENA